MEFIFECHNYSEEKEVKLVVTEFNDYAQGRTQDFKPGGGQR